MVSSSPNPPRGPRWVRIPVVIAKEIVRDFVIPPSPDEVDGLIMDKVFLDWICCHNFLRFYFERLSTVLGSFDLSVDRDLVSAINDGRDLMAAYWQWEGAIKEFRRAVGEFWRATIANDIYQWLQCLWANLVGQLEEQPKSGDIIIPRLNALSTILSGRTDDELIYSANQFEEIVMKLRYLDGNGKAEAQ